MKKDVKNKILFTAQDPGGFNALRPVIKKIVKGGMDVKVCLANESRDIAKRNKINYLDCTNISERKLEKLINEFRPDIIAAATSDSLSIEKRITAWAKKKNIKIISVIDFWSNYKMRFSNPGTHDLAYMPNAICIIDKYMKKEMLEQGFKESQLYITGNPFFDTFKTHRSAQAKYILFASQPFSEIKYETNKNVNSPFFNEVDIFADYVKILKELKVKQPIFIALHPRCKKRDKYNKIIAKSELNISVAKGGTEDLINGAELVIGINTMVLFQAAMIGKKVISYQPGVKKINDPLISNRLCLSHGAYSYSELEKQLKKIFKQTKPLKDFKEIRKKYVNNNSTQKVINAINKFL